MCLARGAGHSFRNIGGGRLRAGQIVGVMFAAVFAAGCATSGADVKAPAPAPAVAAADRSCQGLRSEIMKMEARGVSKLVDRQHDGGKLNAGQKAEIDSYNGLLNEYLGARCHLN